MKTKRTSQALWTISVVVAPEAEDAAVERLSSHFAQPATSYFDLESRLSTISVYLHRRPCWTRAAQSDLRHALDCLSGFGLKIGRPVIRLSKLRRQDWAESWKRHFHPLEVSRALLIKPSWSQRRARRGQTTILLDPGLSFGTGQHPTTGFCLEQIVAQAERECPVGGTQEVSPSPLQGKRGGERGPLLSTSRRGVTHTPGSRRSGLKSPVRLSLLDIGTGSGILALAAAGLGYRPIVALDFDSDAVRIAKENAHVNRVSDRIVFQRQDVNRLLLNPSRTYSVVCANLTADLLLNSRDRIIAQVIPGGILVLAGILKTEFGQVRCEYEAAGVRLARTRSEGEWQSAAFKKEPAEVKAARVKKAK